MNWCICGWLSGSNPRSLKSLIASTLQTGLCFPPSSCSAAWKKNMFSSPECARDVMIKFWTGPNLLNHPPYPSSGPLPRQTGKQSTCPTPLLSIHLECAHKWPVECLQSAITIFTAANAIQLHWVQCVMQHSSLVAVCSSSVCLDTT